MKEINTVHDTIVIIKKDTILKVVEMVKEHSINSDPIVKHFDEFSNFYTALATIAAFGALYVSIIMSNKSSRETQHHLLSAKLEEICELLSLFGSDYPMLYSVYDFLYIETNKTKISKILNRKIFEPRWENAMSQINLEMYFNKLNRLQVLTNLYLGEKPSFFKFIAIRNGRNTLKFNVLGFIEILNSILLVIKNKDIEENLFYPDKLPPAHKIVPFVCLMAEEISNKINFGYSANGYKKYRDGIFRNLFKNDIENNNN